MTSFAERPSHDSDIDGPSPQAQDVLCRTRSSNREPIHLWFGLTYSSYLVLPRSILQSMPEAWQRRFVRCLEELEAAVELAGNPPCPEYYVKARRVKGYSRSDTPLYERVDDPYAQYERGRRQIPLKPTPEAYL